MEQLFDIKTLFAANAALTIFIAAALLFYKVNQKTYSGYAFWMVGAFFVAFAYIFLCLSQVLPVWGFLFVHGFIISAEILRLDGVSRFASNVKIAKRYYWLPAMYMVPLLYFTVIDESALFRNLMLGVFSFVVIILTAAKFFKNTSKDNKNLYIAAGLLYSLYGVLLLAHALSWLMVPQESVLASGKIHQLYLGHD